MKRFPMTLAGIIALSLFSLTAVAQSDTPDFGGVTGSTYTNKYFGLTVIIPSGWSVQDSGFKKQISEKGKELVTSDDPAKKSELNRVIDNTLNLLTATELPPESAGPANSVLICGAEKPPAGAKTDADYMLVLKNTLKYAQVPITIEKDSYSEQIGGVAFTGMDFNTNYSGTIVSQKYYAHIMKDYVLFFIITYQTPEQLKTLTAALRSVTLH